MAEVDYLTSCQTHSAARLDAACACVVKAWISPDIVPWGPAGDHEEEAS
jgi:hypothetical protein